MMKRDPEYVRPKTLIYVCAECHKAQSYNIAESDRTLKCKKCGSTNVWEAGWFRTVERTLSASKKTMGD